MQVLCNIVGRKKIQLRRGLHAWAAPSLVGETDVPRETQQSTAPRRRSSEVGVTRVTDAKSAKQSHKEAFIPYPSRRVGYFFRISTG